MFKTAGLILIVLSGVVTLNKNLILDYMTSLFLKDTVELMQMLKLGCVCGKTYGEIIENSNINSYKDFDISDTKPFFDKLNINRDTKKELEIFFENVGKNTSAGEEEYIKQNMESFVYKMKKLQERCDANFKPGLVAGVSLGVIVFIVII